MPVHLKQKDINRLKLKWVPMNKRVVRNDILVLPCIFLAKCYGCTKTFYILKLNFFITLPNIFLGNKSKKFQYDKNYFPLNWILSWSLNLKKNKAKSQTLPDQKSSFLFPIHSIFESSPSGNDQIHQIQCNCESQFKTLKWIILREHLYIYETHFLYSL